MRGTGYTVKDGWDDAPVRGISLNAQAQEVQEAQGLKPVQADRQHVDNTHGVDIDWGFIGPLEGERFQGNRSPAGACLKGLPGSGRWEGRHSTAAAAA